MHKIFLLLLFSIVDLRALNDITKISFLMAKAGQELHNILDQLNNPYNSVTFWYDKTKDRAPRVPQPPLITHIKFIALLENFIQQQEKFIKDAMWVNERINLDNTVLMDGKHVQPYVIKYQTKQNTSVYIRGDSHGDIQALSHYFKKLLNEKIIDQNFKILNDNSIFFFLGDLTDRGEHGVDALAILFIFCLQNPNRVFIVRGNHEDIQTITEYGFLMQLIDFYKSPQDKTHVNLAINLIKTFFNVIPVAAFIGCGNNYLQFCHGAFEPRYDPKELLASNSPQCCEYVHLTFNGIFDTNDIKELDQQLMKLGIVKEKLEELLEAITPKTSLVKPEDLGFLWSDFNAPTPERADTSKSWPTTRGTGIKIGRALTEKILEVYSTDTIKVRGIVRAHQHNESMPGLFKKENTGVYSLWNNKVLTTIGTSLYNLAPAYITLTLQDIFEKWRLDSYNFYDGQWHHKSDFFVNWKNQVEV